MRNKALILASVLLATSSFNVFAAGDAAAGKAKSMVCAGCHGMDGNSSNAMWPNIAGQHEAYLAKQLRAFKSGERKDAQMAPIMGTLSDEDIANVAAYFASQKAK